MKWIEAINLTLTTPEDKSRLYHLIKNIRSIPVTSSEGAMEVSLYRNTRTQTNWVIHLLRDSRESRPGKTGLGKNFAEMMGKLGQVEHAVWKKVSDSMSGWR